MRGDPAAMMATPTRPVSALVVLVALRDWGSTARLCVILLCANAPLVFAAWLTCRR